jgi:hypothetical protein
MHEAVNLTDICEPIVYTMWDPQKSCNSIWASMVCYRNSFTFYLRLSDLFQTANWFLPRGSITTAVQHTNTRVTQYTYHIHTNTHITQNNSTKNKQNTNSEGLITANEYSAEKEKK